MKLERFARNELPPSHKITPPHRPSIPQYIKNPRWKQEHVSYADAISGRNRTKEVQHCIFTTSEDECFWLEGALVGSLKDRVTCIINGKDIQREAADFCVVSYLGGDLVLIKNSRGSTARSKGI